MIDEDVQAMLRERANDVHPSPDALDRIEARLDAPARRTTRLPMLAAAAIVIVVGLVAIVLAAQRDHDTPVTSTPTTSAVPSADTSPGVFPWPGDHVDARTRADAVAIATEYVGSRVGRSERTTVSDFQQGDAQSGEVVFGGDLATTVFVRRGPDGWYVVGAASDLLTLHDRGDGSYQLRVERKGSLIQRVTKLNGGSTQQDDRTVDAGYELSMERSPDVEAWAFFLPNSIDGTTGLAEVRIEPAPAEKAPSCVDAQLDVTLGRTGLGMGHASTVILFRNASSSACTLVGFPRVVGEGSGASVTASPTLHPWSGTRLADTDDTLAVHVPPGGFASAVVETTNVPTGTTSSCPSFDHLDVTAPGGTGATRLDVNLNNCSGLEVGPVVDGTDGGGVENGDGDTATPNDDVIGSVGASDPRDAVNAYLEDVLGSDEPLHVNDFTPADATHGEVTWQAGVVRVVKLDDGWHVQEAIGDSVQIAGTSLDVGYVSGSLTVAQAGTVHLSVGDVSWDVRNDVDREGTTVRFEHVIPTDEPIILRAVFNTDTGYVSVAEKVIG